MTGVEDIDWSSVWLEDYECFMLTARGRINGAHWTVEDLHDSDALDRAVETITTEVARIARGESLKGFVRHEG